jgi:predicted dehydrogenase
VVGGIGVGERGQAVLKHFLQQKQCQMVALCDVKQDVLEAAKTIVDKAYDSSDCRIGEDFRELTGRKDVDAVMIASTDHWHVLHALAAVRAGKDIYLEKPLGLTLAEDQVLRREVKKRKRVFQFGTQQRSGKKFRLACELVRNGHIGTLKHINAWAPGSRAGGSTRVVPPPETLNYDFWLGRAAARPYTEDLAAFELGKKTWWFNKDFALGWIAGWGIHPMDIALWGAGDLASGKLSVNGKGLFPTEGACNTATDWNVDFNFDSGLTMKFASSPDPGRLTEQLGREWAARYGKISGHGTAFEGDAGWIVVDRERILTQPESLVEVETTPELLKTRLVRSSDHVLNFLEAVKSREATVSPIESAVQSDAFCHIADIAIRLGRELRYDGNAEKFIGDQDANQRLLVRPMRKPWKL